MKRFSIWILGVVLSLTAVGATYKDSSSSQRSQSVFVQLLRDMTVVKRQVVLTAQVNLTAPDTVFVQSDGNFAPDGGGKKPFHSAVASMHIEIDGIPVSNDSIIDWRRTRNRVQHSYNAIGVKALSAGSHTVSLIATPLDNAGPFHVGVSSNLSVFVHPADEAVTMATPSDSVRFDFFETCGIKNNKHQDTRPAPHQALQNLSYSSNFGHEKVVALASGRVYWSHSMGWFTDLAEGDALLGLYLDGANAGNHQSNWSINDIYHGAELQGPVYSHGVFSMTPGHHTLSFDASELPYVDEPGDLRNCREDNASYKVGGGTRMVVLRGGMQVMGGASASSLVDQTSDYCFVGGWDNSTIPGMPPAGTEYVMAEETITVPEGHDGVILFSAKSRPQADKSDLGGWATLRIVIDGVQRGSVGAQRLKWPNCESSRTISASYLAAGKEALKPGRHKVQVIAIAKGSFKHLAMTRDLPLVWFD